MHTYVLGGGFIERRVARRNLSMVEVFREMTNHYEGHTYTDIGTLLLNAYETFFLQYERSHPEAGPRICWTRYSRTDIAPTYSRPLFFKATLTVVSCILYLLNHHHFNGIYRVFF